GHTGVLNMSKRGWIIIGIFVGLVGLYAYQSAGPETPKPDVKKPQEVVSQQPEPPPTEGAGGNPMKTSEKLVLSTEDAKVMLVGIWRIDLAALSEDPEVKNAPDGEKADALKLAQDMMKNVAFEFAVDNKIGLFMDGRVRRGTYAIQKAVGDTLTVDVKTGEAGDVQATTYEVKVRAESLELTDLATKVKRTLVRGAPPTPADTAPQD
ncbi:MAG: hypothetical protein VX589_02350, partial [Myxococcota bacterium]|nr:hypothetical protein [Myxococcota bacterium]